MLSYVIGFTLLTKSVVISQSITTSIMDGGFLKIGVDYTMAEDISKSSFSRARLGVGFKDELSDKTFSLDANADLNNLRVERITPGFSVGCVLE